MSFWGKILGSDKAITASVEAVRDGLDALVYTDEEKASDAASNRTQAREMVVAWMQATQGQNLARRLIALSITATWLSMYILSTITIVISIFLEDPARFQMASGALKTGADDMGGPIMLILSFYFAAPHMGDIAKAVIGKFTKSERTG